MDAMSAREGRDHDVPPVWAEPDDDRFSDDRDYSDQPEQGSQSRWWLAALGGMGASPEERLTTQVRKLATRCQVLHSHTCVIARRDTIERES